MSSLNFPLVGDLGLEDLPYVLVEDLCLFGECLFGECLGGACGLGPLGPLGSGFHPGPGVSCLLLGDLDLVRDIRFEW